MTDRHPRGPEEHKAAAAEFSLPNVRELLALAPNNDPFYCGTPADWRLARWFAGVWQQFGYTAGVHLRRVHYQLFTTRGRGLDGETYENTPNCWTQLRNAGKAARALGLVDPEAFIDQRNDPPRLNVAPRPWSAEPSWSWDYDGPWEPIWTLPAVEPAPLPAVGNWMLQTGSAGTVRWDLRPEVPDRAPVSVSGYGYDPDDQPVLVEVWIEKSTMDDVLVPVCARHHVNLLTGSGFQSITAAISLLRRAERHGKPAHVLYISDFDPAGVVMPISIARQVEFYAEALGIDAELTIETLALTREQVERYDLPRAPLALQKNGQPDRRGRRFEEANGQGVVELDALEALHPGVLHDLVRHAIEPYVDRSLADRLAETGRDARDWVAVEWTDDTAALRAEVAEVTAAAISVRERYRQRLQEVTGDLDAVHEPFRQRLDELGAELHEAQARIRDRLVAIGDELATEMAPVRDRLDELAEEGARIAVDFDPNLPDRPGPAEPDVDRDRLLYDSRRHWLDQLAAYRRARGGGAP